MNVLETERLVLREFEPERDAEFVLQMLNEPAFLENVGDRGVRTIQEASAYLSEKILPSYQRFGFGFYATELKAGAIPIGLCGLVKRETLEDVDVGFSVLKDYWGQGYAFEAASAVMRYGREQLKLTRIVGITSPRNHASMKLLEKLGLRFERKIHLPGYGTESLLFS